MGAEVSTTVSHLGGHLWQFETDLHPFLCPLAGFPGERAMQNPDQPG